MNAYSRVDQFNPLYGDSPYVKQKSGCGEGGDYIHLTPDYVINKQYGEAVWGPYGELERQMQTRLPAYLLSL